MYFQSSSEAPLSAFHWLRNQQKGPLGLEKQTESFLICTVLSAAQNALPAILCAL